MPDIKVKPKMLSPKKRKQGFVPKDASALMRQRYQKTRAKGAGEREGAVQDAVDRVEDTVWHGTADGTAAVRIAYQKLAWKKKMGVERKKGSRPLADFTDQGTKAQSAYAPNTSPDQLRRAIRSPNEMGIPAQNVLAPKSRKNPLDDFSNQMAVPAPMAKAAWVRRTQRQMYRRAMDGHRVAIRNIREEAVKMGRHAADAVKSMAASAEAALGGGMFLILVLVATLVAAIASSPYGIFFARDTDLGGTVSVPAAIAQINMELNDYLTALQSSDSYDSITLEGALADWAEVLAVFSVKVAGTDGTGAVDVVTMDADRVERLRAVFWDMNAIAGEMEEIDHPDSDPDDDVDDSWTEKILHISIIGKSVWEIASLYQFTPEQISLLQEIYAERDMLEEIRRDLATFSYDAKEVLRKLSTDLSPERRAVVEAACSLVGKVNYFWGGKAATTGWDPQWGQLRLVTAEGFSASGTYRTFGLDCSGFVDWALRCAGLPSEGNWYIGGNIATIPIEEALPGDLALFNDNSHVGLVVGRGEDGNLLVCHCSSGKKCVTIDGFDSIGFGSVGRLACLWD